MRVFDLEEKRCPSCFMQYGVPSGFTDKRRNDHKTFYCPGCGTRLSFPEGDTDLDRARRDLERAKQNEAYLNDRIKSARDDAEHERRRRIAATGQVTKLKKRASAGTCPCCNRTFKQLAAHMADKHPQFACEPADDSNVVPLKASA